MNATAQHIALMEALGWTNADKGQRNSQWINPKTGYPLYRLPSLTLDIMAQAEATLTGPLAADYYGKHLPNVTGSHIMSMRWQQTERLAGATKEQRLEAFLRTTGRWTV